MSNPSITADKTPWYQWDTGLTVTVSGGAMDECHFANRKQGTAYVQAVINGVARVPDELLQVAAPIKVYGFVCEASGCQTYVEQSFDVIARNIPSDYAYTKTIQKTIRDAEAARDEAVQAAKDAKASELAADDSAVEASKSAQSAGESASAAATSASNAAKSAGDAAKSASDAKAAASKAVEDASAQLKTYTDNAKTSADNAATSASNAADSASAASDSASAASQSATDASNAKVAAQTAKAGAEAAKGEAATSAGNAAASATAAAKSASDAAASVGAVNVIAPKTVETEPVSGNALCVAIGDGAVTEVEAGRHFAPVAVGSESKSTGMHSVAIGALSVASGLNSVSVGSQASANATFSSAIGPSAHSYGEYSVTGGVASNSIGGGTTAIGSYSQSVNVSAIAVGMRARAIGKHSVAVGGTCSTCSSRCVSIGAGSSVVGQKRPDPSVLEFKSDATDSVALGSFSVADDYRTVSVGNDAESVDHWYRATDGQGKPTTAAPFWVKNTVTIPAECQHIKRRIIHVADPIDWHNAANKNYVDANTSNALVGTVSGKLLHVEDAWPGKPLGLTIDGAYKQDGTPSPDNPVPITVVENPVLTETGKNLCDEVVTVGNIKLLNANLKNTKLIKGIEYTISLYVVGNVAFEGKIRILTQDGQYINQSYFTQSNNIITFTAKESGCLNINGYYLDGTIDSVKLMIELGPTAHDYAPYVSESLPITLPAEHPYLASLPDGTHDEIVIDKDGNASLIASVSKTETADTDGVSATVGTDALSSTGAIADGATVYYKLATPVTYTLGKLDIPTLPETISNVWVEANLTPEMSMTYKQDVNVVIAGLTAQIAELKGAPSNDEPPEVTDTIVALS